jgi:hypothetical protein
MTQQKAIVPRVGHDTALANPFTTTTWLLYIAQRIHIFARMLVLFPPHKWYNGSKLKMVGTTDSTVMS